MKKQMAKIVSLTAVSAILLQTGVFAFGGTYPEVQETSGLGMQTNSTKESWQKSDEDYLFSVGGKTFILLDTDADGNYFVMTDDHYGFHAIDTSYKSNITVQTRTEGENGESVFTDNPDFLSMDDNEWVYDPEDENNIGYWLNNDFWNSGNGGNYILPEEIKANVIEKIWPVEGLVVKSNWTATENYDKVYGVTNAADIAATRRLPAYTVGGKLALMSYTEYKQYQDIIGFEYGSKGWNGFALRTPHALMNADAGKGFIRYTWGGVQVVNQGTEEKPGTGGMKIATIDAPSTAESYVRPVMWLSKDFFSKVKCDVNTIGDIPKAEVLKNSDEVLAAIYDESEILTLKGAKSWDWGHYPEHPSDVKLLAGLTSNANGICGDSPAENLFTIGGRRFILLDRNIDGEYFVMADEEYGQRATLPTNYVNTLPADKKEWMASDWEFNPNVTDSVPFFMNSTEYGFLSGRSETGFGFTSDYSGVNEKRVLPIEIVDDLVEFDWELEPFYPTFSWKTDGVDNPNYAADDTITEKAKEEIRAWMDKQLAVSEKKTVKAKVAHLSYTEYQTYRDKIGFKNYLTSSANSFAGTNLRSTYALIDGGDKVNGELTDNWSVVPSNMTLVLTNNGAKLTYSNGNVTNDKYMTRPVMWLAKDFFKNNKIDVETAGETIFAEMRDLYTYDDLKDTYTAKEIDAMGIEVEKLSDVKITSGGEPIEDIGTVSEITISGQALNLDRPETLIAAVYSNGRLVGMNFANVDFTADDYATVSVTVDGFEGADCCKVMLWSGLSGENAMTPEYMTEI